MVVARQTDLSGWLGATGRCASTAGVLVYLFRGVAQLGTRVADNRQLERRDGTDVGECSISARLISVLRTHTTPRAISRSFAGTTDEPKRDLTVTV